MRASKDEYGTSNAALYELDSAWPGRYDESSKYFAQAEDRMEVYTRKVSWVRRLLANENVKEYHGDHSTGH